jgi:hypothetical protein
VVRRVQEFGTALVLIGLLRNRLQDEAVRGRSRTLGCAGYACLEFRR